MVFGGYICNGCYWRTMTVDMPCDEDAVRPGTTGLSSGTEYSRIGSSTWLCPTSFVSTRIGVELVDVQGNYPTHSE